MNVSLWNPLAPFLQLHRHRELFNQFARRTVEQRHRASFLGVFWNVLTPLISLSIYTFVFGFIWGGRFTNDPAETNLDYALGIFFGLILFNFLGEVLAQSPHVVVTQPNFVKKVVFPLEILPAASVGAAAFSASLSLLLGLLGVAIFGNGLDWHALQLFLIIPPVVLIAFGCAWFFSGLGVFIRDIASAMPFVVQILVYMSAVFYPLRLLEKIPEWAQAILLLNPLLHAVENTRRVVLWHQAVDPTSLGMLWASGLLMCAIGYVTFSKLRPAFADVL
jgi:lipopolysaccharide transport system permease protein